MDERLQKLLAEMPERPPRSKLEPHAEVIRELRKKRWTYQEIAAFFREHLQLSVAPSTIHEFVKTRARQARHRNAERIELPPPQIPVAGRVPPVPSSHSQPEKGVSREAVRDHIRAVKNRPTAPASAPKQFAFDPEEPLILDPPGKE